MLHLTPSDPRYPALLATIPSPPELDVRGTLLPTDALAIAVIGSRQATAYGIEVAETLAADLAARGVTIVSGLALGVVVVEAAERSGALITPGLAGDLGREVFAVPGRITSTASRGTNGLIRDGARLVGHWSDVVSELGESWRRLIEGAPTSAEPTGRPEPESDEEKMLEQLSVDEAQHIERLIARAGVDAARAGTALIALELAGWARQLAGQRWVAVGARARRA